LNLYGNIRIGLAKLFTGLICHFYWYDCSLGSAWLDKRRLSPRVLSDNLKTILFHFTGGLTPTFDTEPKKALPGRRQGFAFDEGYISVVFCGVLVAHL
jgi:hypothetical protein